MTTIIIYLEETWALNDNGWHSPYEKLVWKGSAYQSSTPTAELEE